jgi:leucyl aminopeptidase
MRVTATTEAAASTAADTIVIGLIEGEAVVHDVEGGALQALVDSGEAKATPRHLAVAHVAGKRWILVGLGRRAKLDGEALRVAAATVHGRAKELGARVLCWELPHKMRELHPARAVVEGTLMAAYAFTSFKTRAAGNGNGDDGDGGSDGIQELIVSDHEDRSAAVARAVTVAEAVNAARDLQNTPANHMTPTALGRRAQELAAAHDGLA